ncbi:hypothetical protein J7E73_02280 [Paenibacillus albidus]|uniref:phage tail protein n=1 Tax=Paenibacillus albidus TaxID=2041023 RepID=UPI001BEA5A02|nr:hypothetical protein [Paenibacillus albidus]MBT2287973.1 hypothetical protein [Paenibacillus albidus]
MAGGSAGRIDLDLELNSGPFQRQLGGIAGMANNLVGNAFKGLGGIIAGAFAVGGLVQFGKTAIGLASDLQEVQNVVDVTFGSMAQDINNWSTSLIDDFGLSELAGKKYASTMGAMLKSSGLTGVQMEVMSKQLTELAADMASFYNLSNDEAFYKVFSGMTGETEPLKALGVNMSVANMEAYALSRGINTAWNSMSQMEQTMLRSGYLMQATADAQGDFARTSFSWANQVKVMGEQWKIFQGTMGAGFINILTPVVRGLNWLIAKLQVAAAYFKAFTELIFGDAVGGGTSAATGAISDMGGAAADTAGSMGDLGGAADKTGKNAKKAGKDVKGSLAGFDQLNVLASSAAEALDDAADGASGVGAGLGASLGAGIGGGFGDLDLGTPDVNVDPIKQKVQNLIDGIKSSFAGAWSYITTGWNAMLPALQPFVDMMVPISTSIDSIGGTFLRLWDEVLTPMAGYILGNFIPAIVTGFVTAFAPVIANTLVGAFTLLDTTFQNLTDTMSVLWRTVWLPNLDIIKSAFVEAMPVIAAALDSLIQKTILPAASFFLNDFALPIAKSINEVFYPILADTAVYAITLFGNTLTNVVTRINELWQTTLLPNFTKLRDVILDVMPQIGTAIQDLLDGVIKPFVNYAINGFILPITQKILQVLVPILTDTLVWAFKEVSSAFQFAVDLIVDIYNTIFKPTFDLIKQIVLDVLASLKAAWDEHGTAILKGLSTFLDNTKKTLKRLWDEVLKPIIEPFLQTMKDIWNDTLKGIVDKIVDLVLKLTEAAVDIYNKFIQPMIDGCVTYLGPAIVETFGIIWKTVKDVVTWVGELIQDLLTIFDGIIDFLWGTFTGDWDKAWTGVKTIFKGVFDSLYDIVKVPLNGIIDMINVVLDGLNSINIDIPDWVPGMGGKSFGVNIPRIPRMARGGIVSSPTIAQIGEAGPEAVVPLKNTAFVDTLASALGNAVMAAMALNNTGGQSSRVQENQEIVMQMDGTVLARLLAPLLAKEQQRTGMSIIRNITTT